MTVAPMAGFRLNAMPPNKPHLAGANGGFSPGKAVALRLSRLRELSAEELRLVDSVTARGKPAAQGTMLLGEHAPSNRPRFLMSGWASRQIILPDGRRQIFGFFVPGDLLAPDYEGLLLGNIVALTPVITTDLPAEDQQDVYAPGTILKVALGATAQERERLLHQQVLRLGGMNALQRTAHLLLELCERLEHIGLFDGQRLPFPLTQETLSDALGMSAVHVNRTLKQLRRDDAIRYVSRSVLQVDPDKLGMAIQGIATPRTMPPVPRAVAVSPPA